jgi:Ni,Fe-hydrogenase I small subunit
LPLYCKTSYKFRFYHTKTKHYCSQSKVTLIMANVLWLQGGACSGNTMSFLNAEEPTVVELVTDFGVNILWHPSIGLEIGHQVSDLMESIIKGKTQLDILVYEGSIIQGPNGSGTMNYFCERPMMDWIKELSGCRRICSSHWRLRYMGRHSGSTTQSK